MRLETGMNSGRESLLVHGAALNTVADNIANSNTTGFKDTRLEFADLVAGSGNSLFSAAEQSGSGVLNQNVTVQHLLQGTLDRTGRPLDAAINGKGWFVLNDGTTQFYSRAGNFSTNPSGQLVSQTGANVLGYTAASPDTPIAINLNTIVGEPAASTTLTMSGNLDAIAPPSQPPNPATYQALGNQAAFRTTAIVIDSLGASHDISMYFFRTGNQNWTIQAYADGSETGGVADTPVLVGTGNLAFGQTGLLDPNGNNGMVLNVPWGNGAVPGNIAVDFSNFNGIAGGSNVSGLSADGLRGGALKSVSIDQNGNVQALLESGETVNAATLALADFLSPDGLERVGDNLFIETEDSGPVTIARPASKGLGEISGNSLESSTVDTAEQFTTLIKYQQGYRASSQIVQSISELIKSTIQIA